MPIFACGACVKDMFVTETEMIDRFVGKQLFSWGYNSSGELGDGVRNSKSSPVQTVSAGTSWKQIENGGRSGTVLGFSAAIKTDGSLWLWGTGTCGALGDSSVVSKSSPVQTVSGGTNWRQVSAGGYNAAGIKTDGTLWTWGNGTFGQNGNNTVLSLSSPVQTISAGTDWKKISVGYSHAAAIKTDNTLWLWGEWGFGAIGNNVPGNMSSPVQTVSGGTNWKSVSVGLSTTSAIKTDSSLWVWGLNSSGNLGINSLVSISSPVQTVSGGTNWKSVSASQGMSAVKTDGTLWAWGLNNQGNLGNNNIISSSSPVQTVSGGTDWKEVSTGLFATSAIKTDGSLWVWGLNTRGEVGNASILNVSSPVQTITRGTNWINVQTGLLSKTALRTVEL